MRHKNVQVWGLKAVQAVVNFKWNAWACYYLYCELACYLVWLLGFQVFTIIFQVLLCCAFTCFLFLQSNLTRSFVLDCLDFCMIKKVQSALHDQEG